MYRVAGNFHSYEIVGNFRMVEIFVFLCLDAYEGYGKADCVCVCVSVPAVTAQRLQ